MNLTSYVARHSWASTLHEYGIGLPVISKALGHTDTKTTLIYVEGIKDERLAKANRGLLRCSSRPPLRRGGPSGDLGHGYLLRRGVSCTVSACKGRTLFHINKL